MQRATLTISLPHSMKEYIETRIRDGYYSTPSEYIRSLIRDDRELSGRADLALLLRRGVLTANPDVEPRPPGNRNSRRRSGKRGQSGARRDVLPENA